jgi:hypothetical protein
MNNVEQQRPTVLVKSRRGRLLHITKGFFTVKPAATLLGPDLLIITELIGN